MDATAANSYSPSSSDVDITPRGATSAVHRALQLIQSNDFDSKLQAAKEIRRLTKTSRRCRRLLAQSVIPLVSMLRVDSTDSSQSHHESVLLALLNLAVKDEKAGAGGIARDAEGKWIFGFKRHIGACNIKQAERWGILDGLSIAWSMNLQQVIIECDNVTVVDELNDPPSPECGDALSEAIAEIRNRSWTTKIVHVHREANKAADHLASKTAGISNGLVILMEAPPDLSRILKNDQAGKAYKRNKMSIVEAGALEPVIRFLQNEKLNLQEYATAALLTLSASVNNKPIIGESGAIPLLVDILTHGTTQAKVDAAMALSNLSAHADNLNIILQTTPIPCIVSLLKTCKKSSKTAEKCCSLIESLVGFDEGRTSLIAEEGGVLAVVEVLENGTVQAREHAVGALLIMCESDRCKYREPILTEGVIPGLLELTVQGTPKSQTKALTLLQLLRESPYPRSEIQADTLENIVCNIISQIDGDDQSSKAKKMLAEMVQVSMEQSLRHLQQRALVCTPSDLPISSSCTSQVPSK